MAFCYKCGNELQEGSLFCSKCGVQITELPGDGKEVFTNHKSAKFQKEQNLLALRGLQVLFGKKKDLYDEYDRISKRIVAISCYSPGVGWIFWGIAFTLLGLGLTLVFLAFWGPGHVVNMAKDFIASCYADGTMSSSVPPMLPNILASALMLLAVYGPGVLLLFLGILFLSTPGRKISRYGKEKRKKEERRIQIVKELFEYYNTVDSDDMPIPVGLEYTWPGTLQILINKIQTGSARTIEEAVSDLDDTECNREITNMLVL